MKSGINLILFLVTDTRMKELVEDVSEEVTTHILAKRSLYEKYFQIRKTLTKFGGELWRFEGVQKFCTKLQGFCEG